MKKVSVSTKYMGRFAGKWVAIDPVKDVIVAAGETLKEIAPYVSGKVANKNKIMAAAFKVPYKDEGPYVLAFFK
ncbi:hypothetical protein HYU89_00015 [Candidatus Collierbacteria bacterium]|nr:hypothetical protein [Candidatus Collierbacteria bacterium]